MRVPLRGLPAAAMWCALVVVGCHDESHRLAPAGNTARPSTLRWYRELPYQLADAFGAMGPIVMHVDPGGGLWVAVPMFDHDHSRLFYRAPAGGWRTALEGPVLSEASLSSVRAGEVYFGFNRSLEGYLPVLLRVGADGRSAPMPTPLERIDEHDLLQVGAFAMLSDDEGWACGQRGHLWHFHDGAWQAEPQVFAWSPGDRANSGYCVSLHFERPGHGWAAGLEGEGSHWDGTRWSRMPGVAAGGARTVRRAIGLGTRDERVFRFDGAAWQPLGGDRLPDGAIFADQRTQGIDWAFDGLNAVEVGPTDVRTLLGGGAFREGYGLASLDGLPLLATADGVYRATTRDVPTYRKPPGAVDVAIHEAVALDVDDDGDDDLLGLAPDYSAIVLLNGGDGHFAPARDAFREGDRPRSSSLDVGDVDGDGLPDLVGLQVPAAQSEHESRLWRGLGQGRFGRSVALPMATRTIGTLVLVDVDGDGDLDLAGGGRESHVVWNDGAGTFGDDTLLPSPEGTERLTWVDVDGDGDRDAIASRWRDPAVLLRNDGDHFTPVPLPVVAEGAALADLDGDGAVELYAQIVHDKRALRPFVKCVLSAGGCVSTTETAIPSGRFLDLNLDGRLDVVGLNLRHDPVVDGRAFLNAGATRGAEPAFESVESITGLLATPVGLDVNGDGALDLYTENEGLLVSTAPKGSMLRVRPRASRSDRWAEGAQVVARAAGTDHIVASVMAQHGLATLGLPDASARYDVEVRFPGGARRRVSAVAAGTDLLVRDVEGAAWAGRLTRLWLTNALRLASPLRDLGLGLSGLAALLVVTQRPRFRPFRRGAAVAYGLLLASGFGVAVRAGGPWPWLLAPSALTLSAAWASAALALTRRRAERRVGPYLLLEKLGAGAAATVWRARQGSRTVALKVFDRESMLQSDTRERFFREARTGSEIGSDHVVRILDSGHVEDGRCYLAMQLVPGVSLDRVLSQGKPTAERTRDIGADVAEGLAALHQAGIIHRDVKPGNIMIRPDGRAVVTDLGLVRSALFRTVTRHDVAVGTLSYMSPEQCIGPTVDGRSDVWSLGVVLYELLSGKRPFEADHELELVYRIHNTRPPPLPPGTPPELSRIVDRCLQRDPAKRFGSAAELAEALRKCALATPDAAGG